MTAALAIATPSNHSRLGTCAPKHGPALPVLAGKEWGFIPARYLSKSAAQQHPLVMFRDALTGLANRYTLIAILDGITESKVPVGLVLLDLDGFKDINGILGHDAGDELLQSVATLLSQHANSDEIVARLGGDEFAVIIPGMDCPRALGRTANRFCAMIRSELRGFQVASVHLSAGAALFPLHATTRSEFMKCADIALYASKNAGRDRATVFRSALQSHVVNRRRMLERAAECLRADRLSVLFQPKQDLQSGQVTGYEALLRCRDSAGRLRLPSWISAAFDDALLSSPIGKFVENSGLAFLRDLQAAGRLDGRVAVNVTSFELRSPKWAAALIQRLNDEGICPPSLQVEVNESVLLGNSARHTIRSLELLHDAGVRISLDDFGTGFASLSHLRSCPVDELKIDRSFVKNLHDRDSQAIVRTIIDLGRSLQMAVVAEGVETEDQHRLLSDWGCTEGQGYLYGRPAPATRWWRT